MVLMPGSAPVEVLARAAKMQSPELAVGRAATRFHQAYWRSGSGVAVRTAARGQGFQSLSPWHVHIRTSAGPKAPKSQKDALTGVSA
jgi:hypothetical protein